MSYDLVFNDNSAVTNITLSSTLTPNTITFDNSVKDFTVSSSGAFGIDGAFFHKYGTRSVTLNTTNTFTSGVTLAGGLVILGNAQGLGTGTLSFFGGGISSDGSSPKSLSNNLFISNGAVFGSSLNIGSLNLSGSVSLDFSVQNITIDTSTTFSGVVHSGGFTKYGLGTLTIPNTGNLFTGGISTVAGNTIFSFSNTANTSNGNSINIGTNSSVEFLDINSTSSASVINNSFTGDGTLFLRFSYNASATGTSLPNISSFNGIISLLNTGINANKMFFTSSTSIPASIVVGSGNTLYTGSGTPVISINGGVSIVGLGNSENRGALRIVGTLNTNISLLGNSTIAYEAGILNGTITNVSSGPAVLTLGGASSTTGTFNGVISDGAFPLSVFMNNNTNNFTVFSSANTYSGGTNISYGSIRTTNSSGYGSGDITLGFSGRMGFSGTSNLNIANNITINSIASYIDTTNTLDAISSGIISGSRSTIFYITSNTDTQNVPSTTNGILLSGANTYQGVLTITGGYVDLASNFGNATSILSSSFGGFIIKSNITFSKPIYGLGSIFLRPVSGVNATFNSVFRNMFGNVFTSITKIDNGTVTLDSDSPNFSGSLGMFWNTVNFASSRNWKKLDVHVINNTNVNIDFNGTGTTFIRSIVNNGRDIRINNGGTLDVVSGSIANNNSNPAVIRYLSGSSNVSLTSSSGSLVISSGFITGTTLTTGAQTINGVVIKDSTAGAVSLVKNNNNILTINTAPTYTGGTIVNGGLLTMTVPPPSTGTILINKRGAFGSSTEIGTMISSGIINTNSSGAICIGSNTNTNVDFTSYPNLSLSSRTSSAVYSGSFTPGANGYIVGGIFLPYVWSLTSSLTSVSSSFIHRGSENISISGSNAYTGSTIIERGTLTLAFNLNSGIVSNIISPLSDVSIGSATLSFVGRTSIANTQAFASTTVLPESAATLTSSAGSGGTMLTNLGPLTVNAGSVLTATSNVFTTTGGQNTLITSSTGSANVFTSSTIFASRSASNVITSAPNVVKTAGNISGDGENWIVFTITPGVYTVPASANPSSISIGGTTHALRINEGVTLRTNGIVLGNTSYIEGFGSTPGKLSALGSEMLISVTPVVTSSISAILSDNGAIPTSFTKVGTGTLILSTVNTFTGTYYATQGTTNIGSVDPFNPVCSIVVGSNASLVLPTNNTGLTGTGTITLKDNSLLGIQGGSGTTTRNIILNNSAFMSRIGNFGASVGGDTAIYTGTISGTGDLYIGQTTGGRGAIFRTGWRTNSYVGSTIMNMNTITSTSVFQFDFGGVAPANNSSVSPFGNSSNPSAILSHGLYAFTNIPSTTNTWSINNDITMDATNANASFNSTAPVTLTFSDGNAVINRNLTLKSGGLSTNIIRIPFSNKSLTISGVMSGFGTLRLQASSTNSGVPFYITNQSNTFNGSIALDGNYSSYLYVTNSALQYASVGLSVTGSRLYLVGTNIILSGLTGALGTQVYAADSTFKTLNINNSDDFDFNGNMGTSGTSTLNNMNLLKTGTGIFTLWNTNYYAGTTTINAGTLATANPNVMPATAITFANTAGANFTLTAPGTSLSFNQTIAGLAGGGTTGGSVQLGSATLTLNSNSDYSYAGAISGSGNITKSGTGRQTFTGANTFSGNITINTNSTIEANSTSALGADLGNILVNSYGRLILTSAPNYTTKTVTINYNDQIYGGSILVNSTGTHRFNSITLASSTSISFGAAGTLATSISNAGYTLTVTASVSSGSATGVISGSGGLTYSGSTGINFTLNALNTYNGQTIITSGVLLASNIFDAGFNSSIGAATGDFSTIKLGLNANSAEFGYNGSAAASTNRVVDLSGTTGTYTLSMQTGAGNLEFNAPSFAATGSGNKALRFFVGSGSGVLTVNSAIIDSSVSGITSVNNGASGGGTVVLNGPNTYTGSTSWENGTLSISSIKNVNSGLPSSLGSPTSILDGTITLGSTSNSGNLIYTGSGDTTDRIISLGGTTGSASISSSGTGALVFTSALSGVLSIANRTLTLQGSNTNVNEFSGLISNVGGGSGLTLVAKSGLGYWKLTGSNTFTGNVTVNGGRLESIAPSSLGLGNKTVTVSNSSRDASLVLTGANTYPSSFSFSLIGYGASQNNEVTGGINVVNDTTIDGSITLGANSGVYAQSGDLTINGQVSGAFQFASRAALNRTITIAGGIGTATSSLFVVGPGTTVWRGTSANVTSSTPSIIGGTLRMVLTASSNMFASGMILINMGPSAGQTNMVSPAHALTDGVLEFSNEGASGDINYEGLTHSTNSSGINLTRGTGTIRLLRESNAGSFNVTLGNTSGPFNGVLTFEYGGAYPGTIGVDSKITFSRLSANTAIGRAIIFNGSEYTLARLDANKVVIPYVFPESEIAPGGLSITATPYTVNVTGSYTNQQTVRNGIARIVDGSFTPFTLAAGAIYQSTFIMDMSQGTARTIIDAPLGGKLARVDYGNSSALAVHTYNTSPAGSTINADIDSLYNTTFVKTGPGKLTINGKIENLGSLVHSDGTLTVGSSGSYNNPYATMVSTGPLYLNTSSEVITGTLTLNNKSTIYLNNDLKITLSASGNAGGDIVLSGPSTLTVAATVSSPESTGNIQSFAGIFPFQNINVKRGFIAIDPQYGASVTNTPNISASGGGLVSFAAASPLTSDYIVNLGDVSVSAGRLSLSVSGSTASSNPFATRFYVNSISTSGDSMIHLHNQTAHAKQTFTINNINTSGPLGSGTNVFIGSNIAYYRLAGQTLSGGGTAALNTVDAPIYGAAGDPGFPAAKPTGFFFTSSLDGTENISVTGAITAQTSQIMKTLRTTSNITIATGNRITTDVLIVGSTATISGGEIASQSGKLTLYASSTTNLFSPIVDTSPTQATKLLLFAGSTITVSSNSTHSGGSVIVGGSSYVTLTSLGSLGSGPIIGSGGTGLSLSTNLNYTLNNNIILNDGGMALLAPSNGYGWTLTGDVSGSGDLILSGTSGTVGGDVTLATTSSNATGSLRMNTIGTVTMAAPQGFGEFDFVYTSSLTNVFKYGTGITQDISDRISKRPNSYMRIDTNSNDVTWASSFGNGTTFTKLGLGRLTLSNTNNINTFNLGASSPTSLTFGTVRATANNALGYGLVSVIAGNSAGTQISTALELSNNITLSNAFSTSGLGVNSAGVINSISGTNTLSGTISMTGGAGSTRIGCEEGSTLNITGDVTINTTSDRSLELFGLGTINLSGIISNSNTNITSITRPAGSGSGLTVISGSNTFTGGTTINAGTMQASHVNALGSGDITLINSGSKLVTSTGTTQKGKLTVGGKLKMGAGTVVRIGG